jgi:heme A synthase
LTESIGRPRLARAFAWLISIYPLLVILQSLFFALFYSQDPDWIDIHAVFGDISTIVLVLIALPLAFFSRFPRESRIVLLTVILAVLWIVQLVLGYTITENTDNRWLASLHIPNAFILFGLGIAIAARAHRLVFRRGVTAS